MKKWTRWQNWVASVAGLYAVLSTLWVTGTRLSVTLTAVFGALMLLSGLWSLAAPHLLPAERAVAVVSALLFVSPWVGQFTDLTMAAWVAWVCGAVGTVVGLWAYAPAAERRAGRQSRLAH